MPSCLCPQCRWLIEFPNYHEIPAWCSKCGTDIPRDAIASGEASPDISPHPQILDFESAFAEVDQPPFPAAPQIPSPPDATRGDSVSSKLHVESTPPPGFDVEREVQQVLAAAGCDAKPTEVQHEIASDGRFSKHNLCVGLFLAIWGMGAGVYLGGLDGGSGNEDIDSTCSFLQNMMVFGGLALFISGVAIRTGERWGYHLAQTCAVFQVLAGAYFLFAWQQLRNDAADVEQAVAITGFLRANFDLLFGLVDGIGLSVFLYHLRTKELAEQQRQARRQTSAWLSHSV